MTVKELIKYLEEIPGDTIIIMSRDSEGNSYSPLSGISTEYNYRAEETWYGEIKLRPEVAEHADPEDIGEGPDWKPAVVIWPIN